MAKTAPRWLSNEGGQEAVREQVLGDFLIGCRISGALFVA
jgi:hypothetical protein